MTPIQVIAVILSYFLLLIGISFLTGRKEDNNTFFLGEKKSPWYIVAFGMIGASLSGVTFISVPGWVATSQFGYMQMVLGYLLGYFVIATVLMPLYYRLNLTSIYEYLEQRFGYWSYKTGASFFLLSRTIGAAFRLFLVAKVLQLTIFNALGIPFQITVVVTILLIWLYTFRSGIKTIIWTDTLQTAFMLVSVFITIFLIKEEMGLNFYELIETIKSSEYSKMFFFDDLSNTNHFVRQFFSGAFIALVMTGLDQDMMQKNLSCKNLKEAQLNMFSFSFVLVLVNMVFLSLGALLYIYANQIGFEISKGDDLFPLIATQGNLSIAVALFFILGLVAAAYSSADSALTSLTTSFCIDFLKLKKQKENSTFIRKIVHLSFSLLLIIEIIVFNHFDNGTIIEALFKAAGYTYGPLLGLYSFGLLTKNKVNDKLVPIVCLLSPIICFILNFKSLEWFGFTFGFEILIVNGVLTFIGLLVSTFFIKKPKQTV